MKTYTFGRIAFNVLGLLIVLGGMGFVILKFKNEVMAVAAAVALGVAWGWAEGRIFGHIDPGGDAGIDKKAVGKKYWLQRADGTVEPVAEQSRAGVLKALKEFDWDRELLAEKKLGRSAAVPPCLGFGVYGEGHFLSITPRGLGLARILYSRPPAGGKKGAGLEEIDKENFDLGKIEGVIDAWFAQDWGRLGGLLR